GEKSVFNLLHEEAFAADLRQTGLGEAIARRVDDHDFAIDAGLRDEQCPDGVGLVQRELAASSSELQRHATGSCGVPMGIRMDHFCRRSVAERSTAGCALCGPSCSCRRNSRLTASV